MTDKLDKEQIQKLLTDVESIMYTCPLNSLNILTDVRLFFKELLKDSND